MTIVTRFAPSPTGFLHIGGARTALFNYLFAKHNQGKFLLRIEDTDRERSTQAAVDAIYAGLQWLGLRWDEEPVLQSANIKRHQEVGAELYHKGRAYYCQCSPEALQNMREEAMKNGQAPGYSGHCRHQGFASGALRLLTEDHGSIRLFDLVQGEVTVQNSQIDDMVLLRSDGTPTYMLSVVVDDHDMGVTHVIRGDDHLTNMFRQYQIYKAMDWKVPQFTHIPLIHGMDGAKLSKRHGAVGVEAYEHMGYLSEALRNYLVRLGWSHGDAEIISDQEAIEWFDLAHVGKSPSRFDFKKLNHLNAHYMRLADHKRLVGLIEDPLEGALGQGLSSHHKHVLERAMGGLTQRAETLKELAENSLFYVHPLPLPVTEEAQKILEEGQELLTVVKNALTAQQNWTEEGLEQSFRDLAEAQGLKLGKVAQPVRAVLAGATVSPSIFEIMEILGKDEVLRRFALI
ncbi:MAG: glutamate--tRNA ligase [Alphaproteobacteria bacterium]